MGAPAGADDNAFSLMQPWCDYVSTFTQSRQLDALPTPLKSNGRMLFSCNSGLIWQTSQPVSESIIYTKSGSNFKVDDEQRVSELNDLVHGNMSSLLLAMMAGDLSTLRQRFNIKTTDDSTVLTPRNDTTARFLKSITITGSDDGATVRLRDGRQQTTTLVMSTASRLDSLDQLACQTALENDSPACAALLFPDRIAAGLTTDR